MSASDATSTFLQLHHGSAPLLLPNAWDTGSARVLASLGFRALATTSSGYAASLGRVDGSLSRDEALEHTTQLVRATALPVNADLENCFADEPTAAAETIRLALDTGAAGASIEDFSGQTDSPIYDLGLATDRVQAAAEAAHAGPARLVLTCRAENFLHDRADLADTIARLQAYQEAGADVLYAPGLTRAEDIRAVVTSVDRPVNVLAMADTPPVAELAELGVARISVGGAFAFAALGALVESARELLDAGTYGYTSRAAAGGAAARSAFGS